jgi:hypothetical protein
VNFCTFAPEHRVLDQQNFANGHVASSRRRRPEARYVGKLQTLRVILHYRSRGTCAFFAGARRAGLSQGYPSTA